MNRRTYLPLFVVEAYLVFTLILLIIGPLSYNLHNKTQFTILIVLYHFAFICGYELGVRGNTNCRTDIFYGSVYTIRKRYSVLIVVVFYVWLIVTRNITHAGSYIPTELFSRAISGLLNPSSMYIIGKGTDADYLFHGNKVMTGSVLLIYFLYYCFPAITVLYWNKISKAQKLFSVIIIFLSLILGFASGTNAMIFHVIIPLSGGLIIHFSTRTEEEIMISRERRRGENRNKKRVKRIIIIMLVMGLIFFIYNIDSRLNGNVLAYYSSKSADITISEAYNYLLQDPILTPFIKGLASIQSYMCQGYFGMSLAIDQPFTSTYGIGHSFFLATSFDNMFGTHFIERTYQEKITNIWSRTINWHSFYSQMANDVSFYGVIIIMFVLGIILAKVWKDIIHNNNPIAKLFFIILIPIFPFIPMNNQMGNLYGTFFSFWILFILWGLTRNHILCFGDRFRI